MFFGLFKKKEKIEVIETKEEIKTISDEEKYKMFAGVDKKSVQIDNKKE